jgi:hypothetical protein
MLWRLITPEMLQWVWQEFDCGIDVCWVMKGVHIEALWWMHMKLGTWSFWLTHVMIVQGKKYKIYMHLKPHHYLGTSHISSCIYFSSQYIKKEWYIIWPHYLVLQTWIFPQIQFTVLNHLQKYEGYRPIMGDYELKKLCTAYSGPHLVKCMYFIFQHANAKQKKMVNMGTCT